MSYKTFDEVREFLSGIKYIHDGGCGISALAMYRWLKKNHTEKEMASIKFVYIEYDKDMIYEHKENLSEGYWIDAPCHCVLLYKGELIDAEGYVDVNEWGEFTFEISDEQIIVDSLVNGYWNSCFDRNEWIPIIEKELGIDLSDVLDGDCFD